MSEKKRVLFKNAQVKDIEEAPKVEAPKPMPRSNSTTGLSSLSRSVIAAEQRQDELQDTIENVKNIVALYEKEIEALKGYGREQSKVIQEQRVELENCKHDLMKSRCEIAMLLEEIDKIWSS